SQRRIDDPNLIWLERYHKQEQWSNLVNFEKDFTPDIWHQYGEKAKQAGHSGSDYLIMTDFINSIVNNRRFSIGIHEAMDMTIPGLISQQSIQRKGEWLKVPDSRTWFAK